MKSNKIKLIILFSSLLLIPLFFSCSKDDDNSGMTAEDQEAFEDYSDEYFTIIESEFHNDDLPTPNSTDLKIISITGNSTVLPGGSNPITVESSDEATKIIVGISNQSGYYTIPIQSNSTSKPHNITQITDIQLLLGQSLSDDLTLSFAAMDNSENVGYYEDLEITYMDAGNGVLQVSLSWDQENDVDLHLIEPNGEEIYYGNSYSNNGGELDIDSNPACSIDGVNNENIFYEEDAVLEDGEYEVLVDLWANCNIEDDTNYTITAYYEGVLIEPTEGENPHSDILLPEDESGNSNLTSVMKFDISGSSTAKNLSNFNEAPNVFKFNFKDSDKKRSRILSPNKM